MKRSPAAAPAGLVAVALVFVWAGAGAWLDHAADPPMQPADISVQPGSGLEEEVPEIHELRGEIYRLNQEMIGTESGGGLGPAAPRGGGRRGSSH
ncbi:MAG: hypothetical protein CMJ84_16670 [Planctomycetes bacterium]|nr:hypothetical protein [Planctomycetota bacterium]